MLQPGDKAPDVSAVSTDGTTIRLHDYLGRNNIVLFFYPTDDTAGCTKEACDFRDMSASYDAADTVILGVSNDDQASHQAFTEKYSLNFPLLVDSDGTLCEAFGVPRSDSGAARRTTFLIDTEGTIRKVWHPVTVIGHSEEVLGEVAELGIS